MLSKLPHPLGHAWTCAGCLAKVSEAWACDACHTVLCPVCATATPHLQPAGINHGRPCTRESLSRALEQAVPVPIAALWTPPRFESGLVPVERSQLPNVARPDPEWAARNLTAA